MAKVYVAGTSASYPGPVYKVTLDAEGKLFMRTGYESLTPFVLD